MPFAGDATTSATPGGVDIDTNSGVIFTSGTFFGATTSVFESRALGSLQPISASTNNAIRNIVLFIQHLAIRRAFDTNRRVKSMMMQSAARSEVSRFSRATNRSKQPDANQEFSMSVAEAGKLIALVSMVSL